MPSSMTSRNYLTLEPTPAEHLPSTQEYQVERMKKRILLIDDEASLRRVLQITLRITADWEVFVAGSGYEGVQKAAIEQPDAILLDLMMPEMDGIATLTALRDNPTTQYIPVILLTGKVQVMNQFQEKQLGVAAVLIKPFDPTSLVQQIKGVLDWH